MTLARRSSPRFAVAARLAQYGLWLTAALAVTAFVSRDRYPAFLVACSAAVVALGLSAIVSAVGAFTRLSSPSGPGDWAAVGCLAAAAAASLDLPPSLRAAPTLGVLRSATFVAVVVLGVRNLRRERSSRLSLDAAFLAVCVLWPLWAVLRNPEMPALSARLVLLPVVACAGLIWPGVPRFEAGTVRVRALATALAAVLLLVLPFSRRDELPGRVATARKPARQGGRSVILIVLDTVRRDHLSLYGYARRTTPNIDRHAERGRIYEQASSAASWTLPSHAAMFTGLWPRSHGAHGFRATPQALTATYRLPTERVTLAEIAAGHGIRTAGLAANPFFLTARFGLSQGFEEYVSRPPRGPGLLLGWAQALGRGWDRRRVQYEQLTYFPAPHITRAAISWLEHHADERFFLFLNYMEAHFPNAAPGSQGLPFDNEEPYLEDNREQVDQRLWSGGGLDPRIRRGLVNEYDRELVFLDGWVGKLLDHIRRSGLAERTLVVLTADHGEELGERDLLGHGKDLTAAEVDVPLVVWEPGRPGGRAARAVQTVDIFATILRYLELPIPDGTQAQPLNEASHPIVSEQYYGGRREQLGPQGQVFDHVLRSIRVGDYKYYRSSNGEERLYYMSVDPGERHNVVGDEPAIAAAGRAALDAWLARTEASPAQWRNVPLISGDVEATLRALGYVR